MPGPLSGKLGAFAREAPGVLLLGRGDDDIAADAAVPQKEGFEGEDHRLDIDPICLNAATPARDQEAGGIEDVGLDAVADQEARQPEAVVACLVANLEGHRTSCIEGSSCCKAGQDIEQCGRVTTWNKRAGDLGAARQEGADEPLGAAQLESDVAVLSRRGCHGRSPCSSVETGSTFRPGSGPA